MFTRDAEARVTALLSEFPAVALIGPRQVGKTTLARTIADRRGDGALYLDLEQAADRARLTDARAFLARHATKLVVLDEIHRAPEMFDVLRGEIDERRRAGDRTGHFLILGSAALPLLRQSSESLAGRMVTVEMTPLTVTEVAADDGDDPARAGLPAAHRRLWVRGGFPESFLAGSDAASLRWRMAFIRSYLERDLPQFGVRVPAATLDRFWTMLAHVHGGLLNAQALAGSLGISWNTVRHYLDLMDDLLLIRRLPPWSGNVGKRLVKSPKLYIRDTGLLHALLGIRTADDLAGHPVAGASFEAFAIESLLAALPLGARASFYRTQAGAEADMVVDFGPRERMLFEVKATTAPTLTRGFHAASADLAPTRRFVIHQGRDRFPMADGIEALALADAVRTLKALGGTDDGGAAA